MRQNNGCLQYKNAWCVAPSSPPHWSIYLYHTESRGTTKPDLNFVLTIANILAVTVTVPTLRTVTEQRQNKEPKKQGHLAQWSHRNLQIISQI